MAALTGLQILSNFDLPILLGKLKLFHDRLSYNHDKFEIQGDIDSPLLYLVVKGKKEPDILKKIQSTCKNLGFHLPFCNISSYFRSSNGVTNSLKITLGVTVEDSEIERFASSLSQQCK
jgi:hypothetical protein